MTTIRIGPYQFSLAPVYQAGQQLELTHGEAQAFNSLRAENIRNNFARTSLAQALAELEPGELLGPIALAELQRQLDEYSQEYAFGTKRASPRKGLIEAEAEAIARDLALAHAQNQGRQLTEAELAQAIQAMIGLAEVQQEARQRVSDKQKIASESLTSLL